MNIRIRLRNPVFLVQIILAILTPILAYAGLTAQDLTTWKTLGDLILGALSNPYVLSLVVVSVWNAVNDPTTPGPMDSARAMEYTTPGVNEEEYDDDVEDNFEDEEDEEVEDEETE